MRSSLQGTGKPFSYLFILFLSFKCVICILHILLDSLASSSVTILTYIYLCLSVCLSLDLSLSFCLCDVSVQWKTSLSSCPPPQGPHSQILMTWGGGGVQQRFIFYIQKNHNLRVCLPQKITTFFSIPPKFLLSFFRNLKKSLWFFSRPKKITASFIDPKNHFGQNFRSKKITQTLLSLKYVSRVPGVHPHFPHLSINISPFKPKSVFLNILPQMILISSHMVFPEYHHPLLLKGLHSKKNLCHFPTYPSFYKGGMWDCVCVWGGD